MNSVQVWRFGSTTRVEVDGLVVCVQECRDETLTITHLDAERYHGFQVAGDQGRLIVDVYRRP